MSDDSCIWCHAPVRTRQEAVECDICSRLHQIGKCGNMGYVQYNYDAGMSLLWYEFTLSLVGYELTLKLFICAADMVTPLFF